MELVGRIDRVDKAEDESGVYLRVIDYKSSARELNLGEVYYGLSLQMLTYLDIVVSYSASLIGTKAMPAGVLYFHVHNPMINAKSIMTLEEIEKKILEDFRMNGLILAEENAIRLMDLQLDTGRSIVVPAEIKKDGTLAKRSKAASVQEFESIRSYVRNMYVNTGNSIVEGDVRISPYKLKDRTPCTFCSFQSVCQFDQSMEENEYRLLAPRNKEQALEYMREEILKNGKEHDTSEA